MRSSQPGDAATHDHDPGHTLMQPAGAFMRQTVMLKRPVLIAALATILATGLAACSGSGGGSVNANSARSLGAHSVNGPAAAAGGSAPAPQAAAAKIAPADLTALAGRDIVLTAELTVRVGDVAGAAHKAEQIASAAHGFVATEQITTDPAHPANDSATLTLRVPAAAYDATIQTLTGLGTRISAQRTTQDVTDQVVDTTSRLSTARASIARVRTLLDRATSLGQVISLESELSKREADLESLEQRLATLQHQVALATINVDLTRSATAAPSHRHRARSGFLGGVERGWHAFTRAGNGVLIAVGAVLPFGLVLAAVVVTIVLARRRIRSTPTSGDVVGE
jgi:Domain of unknown function (DUF4349)